MTERPILYGAPYSAYVRIIRLVLIEKGIDYRLIPVNIFAKEEIPSDYLTKHPLGRIPAFEHAGFSLYETNAIARYIDEAFDGHKLQPRNIIERARCNQLISIADNYVYPNLVWGVYVERVSKVARNEPPDERKIAAAIPKTQSCLKAVSELMGDNLWLVGQEITLADLFMAPMFYYFLLSPEGKELIQQYENVNRWWQRIAVRSSIISTKPD